jgi:methylmalonyl-CoA mutase
MEKTRSLFDGFAPASFEQWLQKVKADLKGDHPNSLIWSTADSITIQPYYDASNTPERLLPQWKGNVGWTVFESIHVTNDEDANRRALEVLNLGVSGINFYLKVDTDLSILLRDILIEHIPINFFADGNAAEKAKAYLMLAKSRGLDVAALQGTFHFDIIGNLLATGNYYNQSLERDVKELTDLQEVGFLQFKTLAVDGSIYQNAGATPAQELGAILAHGHEYLVRFGPEAADKFWFRLAVGSHFFLEIAKLRAFRILWKEVLVQYGINADEKSPKVHTQNSLRNKTIYDPWVNLLRSTTETMSAVIGNSDEIETLPFDSTFRYSGNFGKRIARNQQLLLDYESYFSKVADPGAGSYYVENLTQQLCEKGWKAFQQIEAEGGIMESILGGQLQRRIQLQSENEQLQFDNGKLILVGVNQFANKDEQMAEKIDRPFQTAPEKFTVVRPLPPTRLAAKLEYERLQLEKHQS